MIALEAVPPNRVAMLDMIAWSEGVLRVPGNLNGYNVIVGGTLFHSYADHPRTELWLPKLGIHSSAAGRYQLEARWFNSYKALLGLADFSPPSQDTIALQQIRECGPAMAAIDAGNLLYAIGRCAHIWASLPGAGYGQLENKLADLIDAYKQAGGVLA